MGDWGRERWGGWSFARGLGGGFGGGAANEWIWGVRVTISVC